MKKIPIMTAALLLTTMMTGLTSCSVDDNPAPNPVQEELAEATIMWYGVGGNNVDAAILDNFRQFYNTKPGTYDRVNVVAQYKTSLYPTIYNEDSYENAVVWAEKEIKNHSDEQLEDYNWKLYFYLCHPKKGETYRFAIDPEKPLYKQFNEMEPYGKSNADCTNPDSLTSFINWAAKTYPAKKYILVMADHGGGYMPNHDMAEAASSPQRRGLIYDDGYNNKCFSAKSFARGVRSANVHVDGIVLYLCLMNNLEFLYDVKDVTDYIACSTYVMWGGGGALQTIPDNFAAGQDTETALGNFVDANVDSWDQQYYDPQDPNPNKPLYFDLTLTKTSALNDLAPVMKEFTDRLVNTYQNGTAEQRAAIDACTANAVKVNNSYPFYDIGRYIESLFKALPEVFDQTFASSLTTAFNACIAKQRHSKYLTEHDYEVDYSVMLGRNGFYVTYSYDKSWGEGANLLGAYVYYPDGTWEQYKYIDEGGDSSDGSLAHYEFVRTGKWGGTFADTYQQTTFDRLVNWSRWLQINPTAPPAWSPSSFNYRMPDDETIDSNN